MTYNEMNDNEKLEYLEKCWATRHMIFTTKMGLTISHDEAVLEHSKFLCREAMYIINAPDIDIFEALEKNWCITFGNVNWPGGPFKWVDRAWELMGGRKCQIGQ